MGIFDLAASLVRSKTRPRDDQLELADEDGWTVAHILASKKMLPKDFSNFTLADNAGWTVAHVVAQQLDYETMKRFPREILDLKDNSGVSVQLTASVVSKAKLHEIRNKLKI